jgi:hypothetical protein
VVKALARYLLSTVLFMLTCIEHHTNRNIIHTDHLSYVRQWQEDENERRGCFIEYVLKALSHLSFIFLQDNRLYYQISPGAEF